MENVSTMSADSGEPLRQTGRVKWFDPGKGFGFVVPDAGGADILLHINVVQAFGRSSVAEGSAVEIMVQTTSRGCQAAELLSVEPPPDAPTVADAPKLDVSEAGPLQPARVKWFDRGRGFGFVNLFGSSKDIFVHVDVLRAAGLEELLPGEAVAVRVADGPRGRLAVEVRPWTTQQDFER